MSTKYPLEPARRLREHVERDAQEILADALRALERAREARAAAARALRDQRARAHADLAREDARELATAAQLRRAQGWAESLTAETASLSRGLAAALERERAAQAEVDRARAGLVKAAADRGAVDRHFEGWERARSRAEEARAEAEFEDRAPFRPRS